MKVLDLGRYLEILLRKSGALPGATTMVQARAARAFTAAHEAFWAAARTALGDGPATGALVEVLLLHRHLEHAKLGGVTAAVAVGSVSPDVVALEARKAAQQRGAQVHPRTPGTPAILVSAALADVSHRTVQSMYARQRCCTRGRGALTRPVP